MLHNGNVLACIEIVDDISIAVSTNFMIHVFIDPNDGSNFEETDDFTEFQKAVIKLATVETQAQEQIENQKTEFEKIQLIFAEMQQDVTDAKNFAEEAKQISERSLEKAENALDITNEFSSNVSDMIETFDETIQKVTNDTTVTITKTIGGSNDSYAYRYIFNQGDTAISNGIIDISKDMVATNGELVHPTTKNPITINGQQVSSGTYIAMTIANGNTFYINVADLIEYNSVSNTDEIILSDANHTITATVGEIAASKIRYTNDKTVAQAINTLEFAIGTGGSVDQKIQTAIGTLDADKVAINGNIITGIHQIDGKIDSIDEIALTAQNITYDTSNVKIALDTIGTIPETSDATTIIDYVNKKVNSDINALDADFNANGTAQHAGVFVMSGITQTNGKLTTINSTEVEIAGAAATAEQNAKNYANNLLTWGSLA